MRMGAREGQYTLLELARGHNSDVEEHNSVSRSVPELVFSGSEAVAHFRGGAGFRLSRNLS